MALGHISDFQSKCIEALSLWLLDFTTVDSIKYSFQCEEEP